MSTSPLLPILSLLSVALTIVRAQVIDHDFTSRGTYAVQFIRTTLLNTCTVRIDTNTQHAIYPGQSIVITDETTALLFGVGTREICHTRSTTQQEIPPGYACTISNCQRSGYLGGICSLHLRCAAAATSQAQPPVSQSILNYEGTGTPPSINREQYMSEPMYEIARPSYNVIARQGSRETYSRQPQAPVGRLPLTGTVEEAAAAQSHTPDPVVEVIPLH
ncbi:hypothetical protein HDV00_008591 [Rhizophlyctis rosea]|nr:hypothetical protein HDV00_008591 [Rhizophlyctis rosea]